MTVSWRDRFYLFIGDFLIEKGLSVKEVVDVDESTETGGYCETCSYETIVVRITYVDKEDKSREYSYEGSLANLLEYA